MRALKTWCGTYFRNTIRKQNSVPSAFPCAMRRHLNRVSPLLAQSLSYYSTSERQGQATASYHPFCSWIRPMQLLLHMLCMDNKNGVSYRPAFSWPIVYRKTPYHLFATRGRFLGLWNSLQTMKTMCRCETEGVQPLPLLRTWPGNMDSNPRGESDSTQPAGGASPGIEQVEPEVRHTQGLIALSKALIRKGNVRGD